MSGQRTKIDDLYDALKKDGAVSKSREYFNSKMLAPGEEGYKNRLQLYNALKEDGAIESETYEEFASKLGLHAVEKGAAKDDGTQTATASPSDQQQSKPQNNTQSAAKAGGQQNAKQSAQQSVPSQYVTPSKDPKETAQRLLTNMPPQASRNNPTQQKNVMPLEQRKKLWTWQNITIPTTEAEYKTFMRRLKEEDKRVRDRNDPDEIEAFKGFVNDLNKEQIRIKKGGKVAVKTGNRSFGEGDGLEVRPFGYSKADFSKELQGQDYVLTVRTMAQAKPIYNLEYNVKDPEVRKDYEVLKWQGEGGLPYTVTDYMIDAAPKDKAKYYNLYAAYIYDQVGEIPDWVDYQDALRIRALDKSQLDKDSKEFVRLAEETKDKRKVRGANNVADYYNNLFFLKNGDRRIGNGVSYAPIVSGDGSLQIVAVDVTGRPTVADNRAAYNNLFKQSNEGLVGSGKPKVEMLPTGRAYAVPDITNEERYYANIPKWKDLSDAERAPYKDEVDYIYQMQRGQAKQGVYYVEPGQNVEVEAAKYAKRLAQDQYKLLTNKEKMQAALKQAKDTYKQLEDVQRSIFEKNQKFVHVGEEGIVLSPAYYELKSLLERYKNFIDVAPRYMEGRHYSAALQFWNGLTDIDGATFGLAGLIDAANMNLVATNPPKELIEKFGSKKAAEKVIATAIAMKNKTEEFKTELGAYGESHSLGALMQFFMLSSTPLFRATDAVGGFVTRRTARFLGKLSKGLGKLTPKATQSLAAEGTKLVDVGFKEGIRAAAQEGGLCGASTYALGRVGAPVRTVTSQVLGKGVQGSLEGAVLSVPKVFADVYNNRTGQANITAETREGIEVDSEHPFTHYGLKSDEAVAKDAFMREWSQWVGMRLGEVVGCPLSRAVDGKVAAGAKKAWDATMGKFVNTSSYQKISGFFSKMKKSAEIGKAITDVGKYVGENMKRAGMGGTMTFYAQTNLSEMLNAMTVGDVKWDQIASIPEQVDKLWGAAVSNAFMVGIHNVVGTAGYYKQKRDLARHLTESDARGLEAWGKEDWDGIKSDIETLSQSDKNLQAYAQGVLGNEKLTDAQKSAIMDYATTVLTQKTFGLIASQGEGKNKPNEYDLRYDDAYNAGYQVKSPDEMSRMRESLDAARKTLAEKMGITAEEVDAAFSDGSKTLGEKYNEAVKNYTETHNADGTAPKLVEEFERALDQYFTAMSAQRGVSEALVDSETEAVRRTDAIIDRSTNDKTGVIEHGVDSNGRQCIVVSGDPKSEDKSQMLVVVYADNGEVKGVPTNEITVTRQSDPQEAKDQQIDAIHANYENTRKSIADGTTLPEQGDKVILFDGDNKKTVTIDGVRQEQTNDGVKNFVEVTTEDGIKRSLPEEVYRQYAKAGFEKTSADWVYGEGRYANESERRNPEEQSEDPAQLTGEGTGESGNSDSQGDVPTGNIDAGSSKIKVGETFVDSDGKRFTVKSVDGDKFVVVDGEGNEQTYEDGIFNQMVENGLLKRDASENTASTWGVGSKLEINGHEYKVLRVDEANDRVYLEDENGEAMQLPWVLSGLNDSIKNGRAHVIEDTGEAPNGNEEVSTSTGEGQGESAVNPANAQPGVVPTESVTPETAQTDPMPMRTVGKGKNAHQEEDWLATSPQRGHDYIFGETGLDADEANAFVENKAAEAKKNLEKVQKNAPKMGTSISEYKAAKAEHEQQVAEAQKAVDYWNDVKAVHAKRAFEAEKPKEEGVASVTGEAHKVDENNEKTSDVNLEPVGKGVFGNIYDQFKGKAKAAIDFLKKLGGGEAVAALYHKEVGDISLVWGNDKAGLKKILHKHPEVVDDLQGILDEMHVVQSSDNRIVLESNTHKAVVSKKLGQEETPQWLLTAYEKKDASGGSSDIDPEPNKGKQNGTAPLQDNPSSESKVTKLRNKYKEVRKKLAELGIFEESNAMSLMEYQPRANTGSGKMPLSIAKLVKKKVERVLDNPNSTKQDLHDAIRFVMHDGSEVMATTTLFDSLYKIFDAYKDGKLSKEDFLVFLSHSIWCDLDKANDLYEFFYPQWKSQDNAETPAEEKWNSSVVKANNDVDGKPTENSSVPLEITTKGNSAEDSRPIVPKEGEKVGVAEGEKSSGTGDAVPSKEETNDGDKKTKSTSSEEDAVPSETGTNEGDNKAKIDGLLKQLDDPNISPYHKKKIGDELFSLTVQPLSMKLLEAVKSGDMEAVKEAQKDFADLLRIFPPEQLEHIVRQTEFVRNYKKAGENDKAEVTRLVVNIAKKEIGKREKSLLQGANKESGYDWSQYKKGDLVRVKDAHQTDGLSFYGTNAIFDHLLIDRHGNVTGVVVYVPSKLGGGEYKTIFGDSFMKKAKLVKSETDGSKSEISSKGKSLREDEGAEVEQQSESVGTSLFGEPLHKENESSEQEQTQTVEQSQGESGDVQTESGRLPGRSSGDRKYAEGSGNDEKSVRMRKATERVAEMLGTKVVWEDTIEKSNGYYDPKTNTIHVAKDAGNPLEAVFGHESLHRVRSLSEDAYNSLLNAVKKFVGEDAFKEAAQKKYDFYNSHGVKTSMDGAAEEVVGDEVGRMLDDKDYAEKLAYNLKHPVLSAIKDFLTQIKDAIVKAFGGGSEEARKVNDLLRTINKAYRKAVKEAKQKAIAEDGVSSVMDAAKVDGIGKKKYNIRTEADVEKKLRNDIAKERRKKRPAYSWTDEQVDEIVGETKFLIESIDSSLRGNSLYDEWADREPTLRTDWRDGKTVPVVTWSRNNIEYKYDVSADLLCVNNKGMEEVLSSEDMVDLMGRINMGSDAGFTSDDYMRLYETMRDLGLNVPCRGCFDAAPRMKMLSSVARNFADEVNAVVDERNADPEKFDNELMEKANGKKKRAVNGLPVTYSSRADAIRAAVAGDGITEHIDWRQLMSADGQTSLLAKYGGLFRAWQKTGAGRPKDKLLPEPYTGALTSQTTTIIAPYGKKTPPFRTLLVNQGTSLRRNSHTEMNPLLAIDEIQFMRDAYAKNLMVFKYMKELVDVRLFGNMGVKYNMSFFPAYDKNSKVAGLDNEGNYIASEESVGSREFAYIGEDGKQHFDGMRGLEEAQKYVNADCSISTVVFSIPHLIKVLTDVPTSKDRSGKWGSAIPFHASGATAHQLAAQGLGSVRAILPGTFEEAYTDYGKGVTNFEDVQNDRFGKGWTILEGVKAGTEVAEGHKLEFANGSHYYNEGLGVHLFSSWYVNDAELSPEELAVMMGDTDMSAKQRQRALKQIRKDKGHDYSIDYNDKVRAIGGEKPYEDAATYYIENLPKIGLIPRFDFRMTDEQFKQMCADAHVDPHHPKLGWVEGNGWSPIDSDAYYSLFCDYGMVDPKTGKYAPQRPVGYIDADGNRSFRMPENTAEIIKEGVDQYTRERNREKAMHDDVMREYVKRTVDDGKLTEEEGKAFLEEKGIKYSLREDESSGDDLAHDEDKVRMSKGQGTALSHNERVLRDVVIDHMNEKNGIQTSIDHEAGQRVLDMANADRIREHRVYHGSGADFEEFDHSHMGEGEGLQIHGYGTYVSVAKGMAEGYARKLADDGESSNLYTVEIPDNNGTNYLEEDQTYAPDNALRQRVNAELEKRGLAPLGNESLTGRKLYREVKNRLKSKKAASEFFSDLGLNGVHYFGQTDGECYVVFNEKDAKITDHVRFFKTKDGEAYGFTVGGRIYIDPRIANAETPIHEYAHLWSSALKRNNPKEWQNVVGLMKNTSVWDEVKRIYPELKTDDEIADETLSKFSGRQGAERLREEARKIASGDGMVMDKAKAVSALQKVKEAIDKFWHAVADFLHIHYTSAEQVADQVMKDLIEGVDPRKASVEEQQAEADGVKYSLVEDKNDLDRLEHEKTVKAYRAMVMIDGKLYPPMSSKDADGKLRNAVTLGKWEQADEAPDKAVEKNGKWVFPLKKDNGKMLYAAYNPYIHSSRTMLNDQFSEAHNRDNLVVVEVEVPESELTSGYRAEKAKDGVGVMDWKAGIVQGQLTGKREVILSRWDKPVRVVPTEEVAESIAEMLKGKDVVMPSNVVTKDQRAALEKLGVPFVETTSKGVIVDGEHAGETYSSVYGKKAKKVNAGKKYSLREDETRKGSEDDVEEVNSKFNERLDDLVSNPNQKDKILHLGRSSKFLKDGGVADAEIILEFDKFVRKSSDNYENNHPFSAEDIHDLPKAIHNPIALFDNTNGKGGFVILTELEKDGRNFIVALRATEQNRKGGSLLTVNEITTLYPKEARGIINWMNQGRIANADKEKALHFIEALQPHAGTTITSEELSSAANVVENFENPNLSDENNTDGKKFSLREGDEEQASGGVAKKDRVKQIVEDTMERLAKLNEEKNEKRADAKAEAVKAVGGTLRAINKAMSAQREYDLHTVDSITKLAKDMLKHGLLHGLSDYEASRLFSAATNVHGKKDIKPYVQKVMDIMVNNQLGNLKDGLSKLLMMRGKKVNASGVEVQGGLDLDGQRLADTVWHGLGMTEEDIQTQMADAQDRMGDENRVIAHNAEVEYQAYRILQNYHDGVVKSKSEEQALRQELKKAKEDYDAKRMSFDDYVEFREATENAIRENRMDRIEAYRDVMASLGGEYGESAKRAKEFRESEKERINEIHHNANSDMEGRPAEEHHQPTKVDKAANNPILRFLTAPLGTFDQMLRMFGRKNVRGEGYLWNRYMRGWNDARDNEVKGYRGAIEELDNKVKEVFGRKGMKWSDLFALERKLPKGYVSFMDGGEKKTHELTQGNLLYIYMVNKMTDGKMKLRKMGISEEDVKQIEGFLDPRLKQIGDWLQDEYLVKKREKYNEVHEKLFGASMADIDNYFPLKILKNAITQDVNLEDRGQGDEKVSTIVGSVKKRTRNALPLDVMNADAFAVVLEHLKDMEHFAAFGEWNRDLNTLLSYNRFRVQVENMASVYGSGKELWQSFEEVCQIAAGVYRKNTRGRDKFAMAVAKGVTGAKVTARIFTAFKQLTSYPAYFSEANPIYLIRNLVNPVDTYKAWKWSMENLPQLRERWQGRFAGDPILESNRSEGGGQKGTWERWRENVIELAAKYGMSPNAFVDALTISMGTQAVYKTRLAKYKQMGYSDEAADKRAKQDASIAYNQTQQSSEGAYMSAIQSERTWLTAMVTAFRNSSISYTRQLYDALRRMKDRFTPGYKGLTVEFMRKQMERDGIDPDKASENAKKEYRRGFARDMVRIGVFGYLLQLTWNMIGYAPYLLFGDDDKKKKEMWSDIFTHTIFGSIEGLVLGDVFSAGFNSMWRSVFNGEEFDRNKFSKDMPVISDINMASRDFDEKGWQVGVTDVFNILVQSAIGVNPQTLTDAAVAIYDFCGADEVTPRECALLVMRIFNCPKSQTDKVYFDELGMTAKEAQKLSVGQIAERYANYKMRSDAPVLSMTYGDDEKKERGSFYRDKAVDAAKENLGYDVSSKEVTDMQNEYAEMKKKVQKIKDLEDEDRDEYLKQMGELVKTPEYRRYKVAARYNGEMNKLTKKFMRAKTTDERKAVINEMQRARDRWLKVLNSPSE